MDKPSPTAMHTGPVLLKYRNDCTIYRDDDGKLVLECKHCFEAHIVEWGSPFKEEPTDSRLEDLWIEHCIEWHGA